jgi:glycosyltransferase involved in cell wall biosynthesis
MKIAIASSGLGHVSRGIEAWAADTARALNDRGHQVTLYKGAGTPQTEHERVLPCWPRESPRTREFLRWMPKPLGWRVALGSGYEVEQATFAFNLLPHLRRERIDVLHVQDPYLALHVQRANRARRVKTRVILGHGTEEPPAFIRQFDYLQHLAPWHLEEARAAGAWKPSWAAIPNFVDTARFTPVGADLRDELGIPRDGLVVLTAAAVKRSHKRVDHIIDEVGRLLEASPDLPVYLVVAGGWERETDDLIRYGKERLGDRVRFLVRFPRERMSALYRTADVFMLGSLKEMMPIALLEAMASGLPCVVHRHPVMQWMIGAGGEAIDMEAPGAAAGAIRDLLRNAERRVIIRREARRHCMENFGRNIVIDQILRYYDFLLSHDVKQASCGAAR